MPTTRKKSRRTASTGQFGSEDKAQSDHRTSTREHLPLPGRGDVRSNKTAQSLDHVQRAYDSALHRLAKR